MAGNLLTELQIKSAKPATKQYTLRDGLGLFVLVHPNGSKYFQCRTTLDGQEKMIRLGVWPIVTLADAREQSLSARRLVAKGIDPVFQKNAIKAKKKAERESTFEFVAKEWLALRKSKIAPTTHLKIEQTFNANVYKFLAKYPINKIDNLMIRECLLVMERRGANEFKEKTRGWIKQVFDFALADRLISENPIPLTDLRLSKHAGERFPRLKTRSDVGKFLRNLFEYKGTIEVQTCATLMLHLAQRPSELRESKWDEFDLVKGIWTIPIENSKTRKHMKKPHDVMLSKQALELLNQLRQYSGRGEYLFAARITGKPVSEATIRKCFRTCFDDYRIVPHGCRHLFSSEANLAVKTDKSLKFDADVIEAALGHKDKNAIRGIYNDEKYDESRCFLAQWWSDQLDQMCKNYGIM